MKGRIERALQRERGVGLRKGSNTFSTFYSCKTNIQNVHQNTPE